jgi:hypothetical protein
MILDLNTHFSCVISTMHSQASRERSGVLLVGILYNYGLGLAVAQALHIS